MNQTDVETHASPAFPQRLLTGRKREQNRFPHKQSSQHVQVRPRYPHTVSMMASPLIPTQHHTQASTLPLPPLPSPAHGCPSSVRGNFKPLPRPPWPPRARRALRCQPLCKMADEILGEAARLRPLASAAAFE